LVLRIGLLPGADSRSRTVYIEWNERKTRIIKVRAFCRARTETWWLAFKASMNDQITHDWYPLDSKSGYTDVTAYLVNGKNVFAVQAKRNYPSHVPSECLVQEYFLEVTYEGVEPTPPRSPVQRYLPVIGIALAGAGVVLGGVQLAKKR